MKLNKNEKERDEILAPYRTTQQTVGGIYYFNNVPNGILQLLIDQGFANPDDQQNEAPTIGQFLAYMKEHPNATAHGYAVTLERDDYRVSIEGLTQTRNLSMTEAEAFQEFCANADELDLEDTGFRSWWD